MNNENLKKLFKWLMALLVCVILFVTVILAHKIYYAKHPVMTKEQWMNLLTDRLQMEMVDSLDSNEKDKATGRYAAITVMEAMGDNYILAATQGNEYTEKDLVNLAVEYGIVEKSQLNHPITEEDANQIVNNVIAYYGDMDNYPEYCDLEYTCDILDTTQWDIDHYDKENGILQVSSIESLPDKGQILFLKDEYGLACPYYVNECLETTDGKYDIMLDEVSDISEVIGNISYSGKADFSYLLDENDEYGYSAIAIQNYGTSRKQKSNFNFWDPEMVYAAEPELKNGEKTNLVVGGEIEVDSSTEKWGIKGYTKIEKGDKSNSYSVSLNTDGEIELEKDNVTITYKDLTEEDLVKIEEKSAVTYEVTLRDFQVATSYSNNSNSENGFVDIKISSDVELKHSMKGTMEGVYPITMLKVPIPVTGNTVSVNVHLFLIVKASGEISIAYQTEDVLVGFHANNNGISYICDRNQQADQLSFNAKIESEMGLRPEVSIAVCNIDIINPSIDFKVKASMEVTEEISLTNPTGLPPCIDMNVVVPIITFNISTQDAMLQQLFGKIFKVELKVDIISEDTIFKPLTQKIHIESDENGNITTPEKCTRDKEEIDEPEEIVQEPEEEEPEEEEPEEPIYTDKSFSDSDDCYLESEYHFDENGNWLLESSDQASGGTSNYMDFFILVQPNRMLDLGTFKYQFYCNDAKFVYNNGTVMSSSSIVMQYDWSDAELIDRTSQGSIYRITMALEDGTYSFLPGEQLHLLGYDHSAVVDYDDVDDTYFLGQGIDLRGRKGTSIFLLYGDYEWVLENQSYLQEFANVVDNESTDRKDLSSITYYRAVDLLKNNSNAAFNEQAKPSAESQINYEGEICMIEQCADGTYKCEVNGEIFTLTIADDAQIKMTSFSEKADENYLITIPGNEFKQITWGYGVAVYEGEALYDCAENLYGQATIVNGVITYFAQSFRS